MQCNNHWFFLIELIDALERMYVSEVSVEGNSHPSYGASVFIHIQDHLLYSMFSWFLE